MALFIRLHAPDVADHSNPGAVVEGRDANLGVEDEVTESCGPALSRLSFFLYPMGRGANPGRRLGRGGYRKSTRRGESFQAGWELWRSRSDLYHRGCGAEWISAPPIRRWFG